MDFETIATYTKVIQPLSSEIYGKETLTKIKQISLIGRQRGQVV